MENCIEVNNLSRAYLRFALKNVSFNVPSGSVVGFIGENGAGKTTTIKAILGLIHFDSGSVTVLGENSMTLSPALKEKIGVVFDGLCFPSNLNVRQLDKVMRGIYKTWNSEKFFEFMKKFEEENK